MIEYPLEIIDGHVVVATPEARALLDTGAPASVGDRPAFWLCEKEYELAGNYMGLTVGEIGRLLGSRIDVLIGANIMSELYSVLDARKGLIAFSPDPLPFDGLTLPVESFMGVPVLSVRVNGEACRAFLDTGAKLSYLDPDLTRGLEPAGAAHDFYPGLGQFTTQTYRTAATFGGEHFEITAGTLPALLRMTLMLAGTRCILGSDLHKHFKVYFALPENKVSLAAH